MKRIGLLDVDGHNFPNLALMKISAYHKANGDHVEWCMLLDQYDVVYQAKVFDDLYTKDTDYMPMAAKIIKGGTGYFRDVDKYGNGEIFTGGKWVFVGTDRTVHVGKETYMKDLPPEVEHMYPDYSLYPSLTKNTAYGFLTRGCPRNCGFCIVGKKGGRPAGVPEKAKKYQAVRPEHTGMQRASRSSAPACRQQGVC